MSRAKRSTKVQRDNKRLLSVALSPISPEFSQYTKSEGEKQGQLADTKAQVDNAAQAVVSWLLDNPSVKERPYFLSLQERLAELDGILARLVQRKSLSTDGRQWSATVAEVLSLLNKAGQSDGVIAGLPNQLPGLTDQGEAIHREGVRTRKACMKPILDEKGFSARDWAMAAGVDFHTVNDYLSGKTKPFPSTLKKLADALGIRVADLPK